MKKLPRGPIDGWACLLKKTGVSFDRVACWGTACEGNFNAPGWPSAKSLAPAMSSLTKTRASFAFDCILITQPNISDERIGSVVVGVSTMARSQH